MSPSKAPDQVAKPLAKHVFRIGGRIAMARESHHERKHVERHAQTGYRIRGSSPAPIFGENSTGTR